MNPFEFPEEILRYSEDHTSPEDPLLQDLYRTTYLKTVHPQMISGRVQGQLLSMLSHMIRPSKILEIGSFTGYSAYCLAQGLADGGKLITIEINEELEDLITGFFKKVGLESRVELIIGDALEIVPQLKEEFDLIFIDANKEHYPDYFKICLNSLKKGGYLLADNVLWGGKVASPGEKDESTLKIQEFNDLVQNEKTLDKVFLTVRDGLMIARKK